VENRTKPAETKAISGTAKVMHPDEVARALLKGIQKRKFIILANTEGKLIYLAARFVPSLVEWIIDRGIRKAQQGRP
jgi:hypothetical protein